MVYYYRNGESVIESRAKPDAEEYIEKDRALPILIKQGYVAVLKMNNDAVWYELEETEGHRKQQQIAELKQQLVNTDYKAIKYAEGILTEEEYAEIRVERQAWRERINELEAGA